MVEYLNWLEDWMEFAESSFSDGACKSLAYTWVSYLKWGFDSHNGSLNVNEGRKSLYLSRYFH